MNKTKGCLIANFATVPFTCSLYTQSLALKHTYEVYFGYDRTLRKYGRFRQKLPVKTDIRKTVLAADR
uniref:Uncharacterized protein n=1 Tax=Escherichia coli TaxID=562 RepID=A0A7U1E3V4_ECOLX|nr:hypothetical protein [Escherichia coli]QQZ48376.1 hypothetical protein [Escherichia coli]